MQIAPRYRWVIVTMLALAALLNYVDRQTLSLMANTIQRDLSIDDMGYATLVNAFLVAYTAGGILSAYLVDRFGGRRSMVLLVGWWSLASACSGLTHTLWQLAASRFAMGLAEAGGFVASLKLVREWFPAREHAFAIGLYSSAAHIGGALSPIAITTLLLTIGWRWTFAVTGLVGAVWFVAWLILYPASREPAHEAPAAAATTAREQGSGGWLSIMRTRGVWLVAVANSLTNPVWFFYLFWFPKYLTEERGLSVAEMGQTSWIVYAAAGVGSLIGGVISGELIRRGMRPKFARVATMAGIAAIAPLGALNVLAPSVPISLLLGAIVTTCHTAWVTNQTALFVDLYPARHIGKAFGMNSLLTGLVTIGSTYLVGALVATLTYRPMFIVIAIAYPLGVLAAWLAVRQPSMAEREAMA